MELTGRDCAEGWATFDLDRLFVSPDPLGATKERKFLSIQIVSNPLSIIPFNHTLVNLKRAVIERVFFVKKNGLFVKPPQPRDFAGKLARVYQDLVPLLPRLVPWTTQEFLESCVGPKRKRYEVAAKSLVHEPLCRRDAEVEVFIKYEKTDNTTKTDPIPRVISPRSSRFNLSIGKFIKRLEHHMFKSLGKLFGDPTVIKGYNAYESASLLRNKWEYFNKPVAVGLDASRFDQHVSLDALKWEHSVYAKCFPIKKHRMKLAHMLDMQLHNKCVGYCKDGKLKYTVDGTRMSGDMNTSLGNCVIMCSMIKAYADYQCIEVKLANNGDDCVVFMESSDLHKFSDGLYEWFYEMGFDMKIETPVFEFESVEFCQTHPVFDGYRWIMLRNPHTALSKDQVFLQPFQSWRQVYAWMSAVGIGGLRMTGGLPVFQNFYRVFARYGSPGRTPFKWSWYTNQSLKRMDRDFGPVTPEARSSFWSAYDLTPDEQLLLESEFDRFIFKKQYSQCR